MDNRTLTESDVKAIVDELERRAAQRFQINIGRGVLGLAWKACFYLMLWLRGLWRSRRLQEILQLGVDHVRSTRSRIQRHHQRCQVGSGKAGGACRPAYQGHGG